MDEDWDGNVSSREPTNTSMSTEQQGRSYGKGRGFVACNNNDNEWDTGSKSIIDDNGFGTHNDDNGKRWTDNFNTDSNGGRFGRGGGRGGSRGGGRGNGRGGYRNKRENDGEDGFSRESRYNDDDGDSGGYKPSGDRGDRGGRGGRRGGGRNDFRDRNDDSYRNDGDRNFGNNDFDNGGFESNRKSRYGDNEESRRGRGRGGGRGGSRSYGRGDDDDDQGQGQDKERPKVEMYIPPDAPTDEKSLFENGVEMGINFDKYDEIVVKVTGENAPNAIESFEEAGLRSLVLENIIKSGYKKPTPIQKHALPIIMNGRDLMACAQTGSGKTAAFVVPIVNTLLERPTDLVVTSTHCEPQAIIVSPTRELTIQIWRQVLKFSLHSIIKTVVAYGGTSVMHQGGKLSNGCHILVATPGRLLDFLGRGRISFASVRFLVLDEADRMLDMGFLPDIERIVDHESMVRAGERQTLMFSATFPDEVQHLASRFLDNYLFVAVGIVGGACSDVEQAFYEVTKFKKRDMLKDLLEKENDVGIQRTLVFVEMKRTADFMAAFLSESNFPTTSIHGDRMQREREEALADFTCGRMSILVGTSVAARGLDIKNVAHVINYDMPKTIDEYVHRIGRTGRVGNRGRATSFLDPDNDAPIVPDLLKILKQAGQPIPDWLSTFGGGGSGSGSRNFGPGRARRFGGEDVRNFDEPSGGVPYGEEAYTSNVPLEPEEEW